MSLDGMMPREVERLVQKQNRKPGEKISMEVIRAYQQRGRKNIAEVVDLDGSSSPEDVIDKIMEDISSLSAEEQKERLHLILDQLEQISGSWNMVEIYTPSNVVAEKKKFLEANSKGEMHNPRFEYEYAESFDLGDSRIKLEKILHHVKRYRPSPKNRFLRLARIALYTKVKEDLATCDVAEGLQTGNEELVKKGLNVIYAPSSDLIREEEAKRFIKACNPLSKDKKMEKALSDEEIQYLKGLELSPEDMKNAIEWGLKEEGLFRENDQDRVGFRVEISDDVESIDVRHRSKNGPTIFIPNRPRPAAEFLPVMEHEFYHVRQSVNGQKLFRLGGGSLSLSDEQLYEGVALAGEERFRKKQFGYDVEKPPRLYAEAIEMAEQGASFHEIFTHLMKKNLHAILKISPDIELPSKDEIKEKDWKTAETRSWKVAYRVMRGHINTDKKPKEKAYAMRKDLAYTAGELTYKALEEKGYGHYVEAAIASGRGGLAMMGEFDLSSGDLPHPGKDVTVRYMQMLLEKQREEKVKKDSD